MGKIIFTVGVMLAVAGVLTLNLYGSWVSAGSLFFGIVFIVFGLFLQVGFFSGNLRSLGGVGTILICVSIIIVAYAIVIMEFLKVDLVTIVPVVDRGSIVAWRAVLSSDRPFLWMSVLLVESGLAVFASGIVLRIIHAMRP